MVHTPQVGTSYPRGPTCGIHRMKNVSTLLPRKKLLLQNRIGSLPSATEDQVKIMSNDPNDFYFYTTSGENSS